MEKEWRKKYFLQTDFFFSYLWSQKKRTIFEEKVMSKKKKS